MSQGGYPDIEEHGIVGNMLTVALCSTQGCIDWMCFPYFNSPSIFASVLDKNKGGYFQISPRVTPDMVFKQHYWPDTNVLVTRFLSEQGVAQVIDFMAITDYDPQNPKKDRPNVLVRQLQVVHGKMDFDLHCFPAFNFARDQHETQIVPTGAHFLSSGLKMALTSSVPLTAHKDEFKNGVTASFNLIEGQAITFSMHELVNECTVVSRDQGSRLLDDTLKFWQSWIRICTYRGRWREMVHRSALVLKLLTFSKTGAIVAAPTCSLPEAIGGPRNWDYRYTWIRDASFTLYAFLRLGFVQEATEFMSFLMERCNESTDGTLQIMYGIDGEHKLTEEELTHLEGYRQSSPVRIGNGAYNQLQLDIYGELLDSVYIFNKEAPISYDLWVSVRKMVDWVCENWHLTDEGIWEVRGGKQHFVYSKVMLWVAVDRGLRLAEKRSFPAPREKWMRVRDEIYEEIMNNGYNRELGCFTQYYGSTTLDASTLILPMVLFISPIDPRMLNTLEKMSRAPAQGGLVTNSLVYRYDAELTDDGLAGEEGTFNMCSFWMIEALARSGKAVPENLMRARQMFEEMLTYSNHLGLFAEETGVNGRALGNFPQAFTHLALISSAHNLNRHLG